MIWYWSLYISRFFLYIIRYDFTEIFLVFIQLIFGSGPIPNEWIYWKLLLTPVISYDAICITLITNSRWRCGDCWRLTQPRCGACGLPILDQMITALDSQYHAACFTCSLCSASLDGGHFIQDPATGVICRQCYVKWVEYWIAASLNLRLPRTRYKCSNHLWTAPSVT